MAAPVHAPIPLSFGRGVAARLSLELRAMLSEQNVHVSQDIIAALMPRVRTCIDDAMADCARDSPSEDDGRFPVLQSPPISSSQGPLAIAGKQHIGSQEEPATSCNLPDWFSRLLVPPQAASLLLLPEWLDASYRRSNGWCGADYVHAPSAPAHIAAYALLPPSPPASAHPSLTGVAVFTPSCESHKRICHGAVASLPFVCGGC
jgi:hypothetical protein